MARADVRPELSGLDVKLAGAICVTQGGSLMHFSNDRIATAPRVCDLAGALARLGSNARLVREMLEIFREDAPGYQSRLHEAISRGESSGVQHASHSLRGMLSVFGADAAMQVALRLERMGEAADLSDATEQESSLSREISRFLEIMNAELDGH